MLIGRHLHAGYAKADITPTPGYSGDVSKVLERIQNASHFTVAAFQMASNFDSVGHRPAGSDFIFEELQRMALLLGRHSLVMHDGLLRWSRVLGQCGG